jgi:mxaJ protein
MLGLYATVNAEDAHNGAAVIGRAPMVLTVCADPNNLPFSNSAGAGFENKIAALIARDLGSKLRYVWWAQRRGYLRHTLDEEKCDIWPGVAAGVDNVATTRPYYRSTYVFVSRAADSLGGLTLDDSRLRSISIGVQMIGNDATNTPPAHAVASRGLIQNVHGYMIYGDYGHPNPPANIIDAVVNRSVDVAMVWGPLAGYFAQRAAVPLRIEPVTPTLVETRWPMTFDICVGVRRDDPILLAQINAVLTKEKPNIDSILRIYGVPRAAAPR